MAKIFSIIIVVFFLFVIGIFLAGFLSGTLTLSVMGDDCAPMLSNGKYNPKYRDMLWKCSVSQKCNGAATVNQKTCDCECK